MKRILFTFFFITTVTTAIAQMGTLTGGELDEMKTEGMKAVLYEEDPVFNKAFKNAIKDHWNFCELTPVSHDELGEQYEDGDKLYMLGYHSAVLYYADWKITNPNFGVSKIYTSTGKIHGVDEIGVLIDGPLETVGEEYYTSYVTLAVKIMNKLLTEAHPQGFYTTIKAFSDSRERFYNKVKRMKILICEDDFKTKEKKITKKFNFDYEIVPRERIKEAIMNEEEDVLIYYLTKNTKYAHNMLVSPVDGEIYYHATGVGNDFYIKVSQNKMFKRIGKH